MRYPTKVRPAIAGRQLSDPSAGTRFVADGGQAPGTGSGRSTRVAVNRRTRDAELLGNGYDGHVARFQ